jgi:glycosyltransferase involved in cell wall biosynthesis
VKDKYSLPDLFFLTFSTLEPRKNLESVMKAFSIFQKKHPLETYRLVMAGRRDSSMFGRVFMEEHPDISPVGFIDEKDKAAVYSLARGLLFVSTYEGFGLPVLESMSCGTPVIASSVASMPEVAGGAAILVDPYDVEAIADSMERLTHEDIYGECRQKGLERVKAFSWKKAARATLKVLTSF